MSSAISVASLPKPLNVLLSPPSVAMRSGAHDAICSCRCDSTAARLLTADEDRKLQHAEDEDVWATVMRESGNGVAGVGRRQQHGPAPPSTTLGTARPGDWLMANQGALRRAARNAYAAKQSGAGGGGGR